MVARILRSIDLYVIVPVDGKEVAYKNPKSTVGHEDIPLAIFPYEALHSEKLETYYNICWFDCGALFRCEHSFHRTADNARHCEKAAIEGSVIGKVLEEQ